MRPRLRKPSPDDITTFLATQARHPFTYTAVGATATAPPAGFTVDHTRVQLGAGIGLFEGACAALQTWQHFNLGWVLAIPDAPALQVGIVVAIRVKTFGVYWLNACRIVYLVDDNIRPIRRFGFAYGTLPAHAETGEERFLIEWNQTDDTVHYDILTFSKPRHVLAKIAYPLTRKLQRRFAHDSTARMVRAVSSL